MNPTPDYPQDRLSIITLLYYRQQDHTISVNWHKTGKQRIIQKTRGIAAAG
ncbi:hypothetical protein [Nitrosomonas marina]|uniref:hypothetical protein n=1 Tax=Nitrosomonas marina TaxID=917 RepID=UPI0015A55F5A|nr:hypothetical protein [Nitrosomonas marina]